MKNLNLIEMESILSGKSKGGFLVEFSTPWCGVCKIFQPVLDSTVKALNIELYNFNADQSPEIQEKLEISSVPTTIFFKDGEEKVRFAGLAQMKDIVSAVHPLI